MNSKHHAPVSERKSVSVGSVCVLSEPWLELLADRVLLLLLMMTMMPKLDTCVNETFLRCVRFVS